MAWNAQDEVTRSLRTFVEFKMRRITSLIFDKWLSFNLINRTQVPFFSLCLSVSSLVLFTNSIDIYIGIPIIVPWTGLGSAMRQSHYLFINLHI